jgi:hypothetical protein
MQTLNCIVLEPKATYGSSTARTKHVLDKAPCLKTKNWEDLVPIIIPFPPPPLYHWFGWLGERGGGQKLIKHM